jgi:predicted Zn finger-like uncharacterized protein
VFHFSCPSCRSRFRGKPDHVGRQVKCPKCGTRFVVTHEQSAADSPDAVKPRAAAPAPVSAEQPTARRVGLPVLVAAGAVGGAVIAGVVVMVGVLLLGGADAAKRTRPASRTRRRTDPRGPAPQGDALPGRRRAEAARSRP